MIEVRAGPGVIEAVDAGKNEVRVAVDGLDPAADGPGLDRRVDACVSGTAGRLSFPEAAVSIERVDEARWAPLDGGATLSGGPYVLKVELPVVVSVAFSGPCRVGQR